MAQMLVTPFSREMIYWIIVALCLVAHAAILRSTLRAAGGAPPGGDDLMVPARVRRRPIAEVLWAIVPAAALALLLMFAHGALR